MLDNTGKVIWQTNTGIAELNHVSPPFVSAIGEVAQDFKIPDNSGFNYLYLNAKGGDGGARQVKEITGSTRFIVKGGGGASITATFQIGGGVNMIPPGSTIRFIVGKKGGTRTAQGTEGCAGGGTAVLFRKPNAPRWYLLLAAGGGGGAYSDCCTVKSEGRSAQAGTSGANGGGAAGGGDGGTNGNHGGRKFGDGSYTGGAGGGAFTGDPDYTGDPGWHNGNIYPDSLPTGGKSNWPDNPGGWGFGAGGGGGDSGGGDGGYSGGGLGQAYFAGGGGRSYVNSDFARDMLKIKNPPTNDPQDGIVRFNFTNSSSIPGYSFIHWAQDSSKCIDVADGSTSTGANVQLYYCTKAPSQKWFYKSFMLIYGKDYSRCLELSGSTAKTDANIDIWTCNDGTNAQKWIYDGVNQAIRSRVNLDYCIDLEGGSSNNGTNIQLWECKNVAAQKWLVDGATTANTSGTNTRIHLARDQNVCMDVKAANTANGTNIQIYHCHDSNAQYWVFDGLQIKMKGAPNKCLDLSKGDTSNGANIQLWDCQDGNMNQVWIYDGMIKSFRSGKDPDKCIDVVNGGSADGTNIQLWDCKDGFVNQQFVIRD